MLRFGRQIPHRFRETGPGRAPQRNTSWPAAAWSAQSPRDDGCVRRETACRLGLSRNISTIGQGVRETESASVHCGHLKYNGEARIREAGGLLTVMGGQDGAFSRSVR